MLNIWRDTHPRYKGSCAKHAKDLGAAQRGVGMRSRLRKKRIATAKARSHRVRALKSGRASKITVTRASLQAGALYACEVDPLTKSDLQAMRLCSSVALNYDWGPNNRVAAMLFECQGLYEPKAQYYFRVLKNWRRQMQKGMGPTQDIRSCWAHALNDSGRPKGPIHTVIRILLDCGVQPESPVQWKAPGVGVLHILSDSHALKIFREWSVNAVWAELAQSRRGYQGLSTGMDHSSSWAYHRTIKNVQSRNRLKSIFQDGVWTPYRAGRVNAGEDVCIFCGAPGADVLHFWWHCPSIPRHRWNRHGTGRPFFELHRAYEESLGQPKCLWHVGLVPQGYVPRDRTPLKDATHTLAEPGPITHAEIFSVCTDGSGHVHTGTFRAGYGVHVIGRTQLDGAYPLLGWDQSVQRAELMAVCKALEQSTFRFDIVLDNKYVLQGIRSYLQGGPIPGTHSDLWSYIHQHGDRIVGVHWIKSHIPDQHQAGSLGFPGTHWSGNRVADCLAKKGLCMHPTDSAVCRRYLDTTQMVHDIQRHMLCTWEWILASPQYAAHKSRRAEAKTRRQQKDSEQRAPRMEEMQPSKLNPTSKHAISTSTTAEWCVNCGRYVPQERAQWAATSVWRRPCAPLKSFSRILAQGHVPIVAPTPTPKTPWTCSQCRCAKGNLGKIRCTASKVPSGQSKMDLLNFFRSATQGGSFFVPRADSQGESSSRSSWSFCTETPTRGGARARRRAARSHQPCLSSWPCCLVLLLPWLCRFLPLPCLPAGRPRRAGGARTQFAQGSQRLLAASQGPRWFLCAPPGVGAGPAGGGV